MIVFTGVRVPIIISLLVSPAAVCARPFNPSVMPSGDERIATVMTSVNWYRKAVRNNLALCKPTFSDPPSRVEFEKLWRDECYGPAYARRHGILARLESGMSQNALVSKVCAAAPRLSVCVCMFVLACVCASRLAHL